MLDRIVPALSAVFLLFAASPAAAAEIECPTAPGQDIESLLSEAPTCDRAMDLFRVCALGSSGDISLGAVVREKCEGEFLARLRPSERRTYERRIRSCHRRFARESGTMYRSFEAFCAAAVAQSYARRAKSRRSRR